MQYFVGDFDGKNFIAQKQDEILYVDEGKDFYAAIPFNNLPKTQPKPIMIGWINDWEYANEIPTGDTWRGGFSIPRELSLKKTANGLRLIQQPVAGLNAHQKEVFSVKNQAITSVYEVPYKGDVFDLSLEIQFQQTKAVSLKVFQSKDEETVIRYEVATQDFRA
jgi:fructan beta-fructosidase